MTMHRHGALDAVAHTVGLPLWQLFDGHSDSITTDTTIPICSADEAGKLAAGYANRGFKTIKTKVGGRDLTEDIKMLTSISHNHPTCSLILDANGGYQANDALDVLKQLHELKLTPALFEQPVAREDWKGLDHVSQNARDHYGVLVAADESCRSVKDVTCIVNERSADIVNIKLSKMGVLVALEVVEMVQQSGLELMRGGMVETRLAMGFAAHMAAGLGCSDLLTSIHLYCWLMIQFRVDTVWKAQFTLWGVRPDMEDHYFGPRPKPTISSSGAATP